MTTSEICMCNSTESFLTGCIPYCELVVLFVVKFYDFTFVVYAKISAGGTVRIEKSKSVVPRIGAQSRASVVESEWQSRRKFSKNDFERIWK